MSLAGIWPYALVAVLIIALIVLIVLVLLLRKSAKSTTFVDAEGEEPEAEETEPTSDVVIADIPGAFRQAAKLIDRAADGDRKNVPLFLMVGDRGARDSDLLANTGLELTWGTPEVAETAMGEGRGFWVFGGGTILDTVGDEANWDDSITRLTRLRPKRPIDGVIVTFSLNELLEAVNSEVKRNELSARAGKTYRRLWDAQQRFGFRLPTYVLITGCESITGFRALCRSLRDVDRRQIVGWSNPNAIDAIYRGAWVDEALQGLASRIDDVALEVFSAGTDEGDHLLRLTPGLASLGIALRPTIESLFKASAYYGTLIFRGLYFCGREHEPATDDAAPSGNVAFLADLLDQKIFLEHRLAAPTTKTVMARNRAVKVAKTIAATAAAFALLSIVWTAFVFQRQNAILDPLLSDAAEAMAANDVRGVSPTALAKNAINLLNGMSSINFERYDSVLVPVSWFMPFQPDLEQAFTDAFHDIILRAIRSHLHDESKKLVPEDPRIISLVNAPPARVVDHNAPPPWVAQRLVPIGSIPEFQELRKYANDLNDLDAFILSFNGLHDSGDLRQLGKLVRFSFGLELPESFYHKARLYQNAMVSAQYKKLEPDLAFREGAAAELNRRADEFHDALFRRNPFTARLQKLSLSIENLTWQPPARGDTTPLRDISDQLKRLENDLGGSEMDWAFRRDFDFGPAYKEIVDDVKTTSYFGPAAALTLRKATVSRWSQFQQGLASASTPLTKTVLAIQDNRPQQQLSSETVLLQSALATFFGQSFVASARNANLIRTELSDGYRLNWNTAELDQAIGFAQAYDRFRTNTLPLFPADVRVSVDQVARDRALSELLAALGRARMEERIAYYIDSPSEREEQVRLDITRFNTLTPALEAVLDASTRLSPEAGYLVGASVSAEAVRILRVIDGFVDRDRPYATLDDIARWDGNTPPTPRVWGKRDDTELATWLETTRGRLAFIAMNYAKPPLTWLSKAHTASSPDVRGLVGRWSAIVDDVRDFDAKKPGNSIAVLEDYVAIRMAKVTARDCSGAELPSGFAVRSFFGQTAYELSQRVSTRCLQLAGKDSNNRYRALEQYFNQRLAGRYPFAEKPPRKDEAEAEPADVRAFFKLFDANKDALIAAAAKGGLDDSQRAQRQFVDDMQKVRAFFATFLDAPKPEFAPSFDVEPTFRTLKPREYGGAEIIDWKLEVDDEAVSNRAAKPVRWTAGKPVRVTLRWADNGPRIPVVDAQPRAALDGNRKVVWAYNNRWSLLAALADHPVRAEELPGYSDALPVTLAFDLATKPADGNLSDLTPVRVFMRLALLAAGTNQPVELPRFPTIAPRMESVAEGAP